jgi:beta-lactamase regulating signal transducer with metallopeptidase domain
MSRMLILYLLSITMRSLIFAALAGVAAAVTKKVQIRHAIWVLALSFLFLAPLADALLPPAFVPASIPKVVRPIQTFIVYSPILATQTVATSNPDSGGFHADRWNVTAFLILSVTTALLLRLTLVLREVARLKEASLPASHAMWDAIKNISVRESNAVTVPLTAGFWKPFLILPSTWRDWNDWKLCAVLTHERTHVQRRDWAINFIAAVAKCLFWFNPLVWWLERKLSSLAEQACDEASVQTCGDGPRYAETLLEFASAARRGHRWMGGVAMAQHKISLRIERILSLRRPGSGVLPRLAWILLLVLALPALYISAASQSRRQPALKPPELRQLFQPLLAPAAIAALPQPSPQATTTEARQSPAGTAPRQAEPVAPSPVAPPAPSQQVPPLTINPDLVGEIRLILAPVDAELGRGGSIQYTTRSGTNRWSGTAVWNFVNSAVSPSSWNLNNATAAFVLMGIEGRRALFEDRGGNTFSYGCPDCTFFVSQSGVGPLPSNPDAGIAFQLSADGKLLSATCYARECRAASVIGSTATAASPGGTNTGGVSFGGSLSIALQNSQTASVGIAQSSTSTCFNLTGSNKVDGTPFTSADCERNPATAVLFWVTR